MAFSNTTYTITSPADADTAASGADAIRQVRNDVYQRLIVMTKSDDTGWGHTATDAKDEGLRTKIASFSQAVTINSAYGSTVPVQVVHFKLTQSADMLYEFSFEGQENGAATTFGPDLVYFDRGGSAVGGSLQLMYYTSGEVDLYNVKAAEQGLVAGTYSLGFFFIGSVASNESISAHHCTLTATPVFLDNFG